MRIAHCISSLDVSTGGPAVTVVLAAKALARLGHDVLIYSLASENPLSHTLPGCEIRLCSGWAPRSIAFSTALQAEFREAQADVFHGHGLWQLPVHYMMRTAIKRRIPAILSPHGMLEPGAMQFSRLKKTIAKRLFQWKDLCDATCLHVTSEMEAENIRKMGFAGSMAIVDHGIDTEVFTPATTEKDPSAARTLLFMSRLHPKKGVPYLLEAWSIVGSRHPGWRLLVVGPDENGHRKALEELAHRLNVAGSVEFRGAVYGREKIELLRNANLFVLPSLSENFGIVILEALACGVPVITTRSTPWRVLQERECGWWIEQGTSPLASALHEALSMSDVRLRAMGLNGRRLSEERYSIDIIGEKLSSLYNWIAGSGARPAFVL